MIATDWLTRWVAEMLLNVQSRYILQQWYLNYPLYSDFIYSKQELINSTLIIEYDEFSLYNLSERMQISYITNDELLRPDELLRRVEGLHELSKSRGITSVYTMANHVPEDLRLKGDLIGELARRVSSSGDPRYIVETCDRG